MTVRRVRSISFCLLSVAAMLVVIGCDDGSPESTVDTSTTTPSDTSTTDDDTATDEDTSTSGDDTTNAEDTSGGDGDTTPGEDTTGGQDTVTGEDTSMGEDTHVPDGDVVSSAPTYHEDIAPVLAENCLTCHVDGSIAPFALDSYAAASALGAAIVDATGARRMPPWGADNSGACQTFEHARWLEQAEIDLIAAWVDGGSLEGDPANNTAEIPPLDMLTDATVTLDPGVEYTPNAASSDDYRCFVVEPGNATDQFLTDFQVNPGEPDIVHHMVIYTAETQAAAQAARDKDAASAEPGYTCYGTAGISNSSFLAAWAPGVRTVRHPEGTGVRVKGGLPLVMQVHYNLVNGAKPDRTTVDLKLVDSVDQELELMTVFHTGIHLDPGQAEEVEVMDRAVSTGSNTKLYGVFPHMHTLGRKIEYALYDASDAETCALDVPDWDFNWQQSYFYETPLDVSAITRHKLTCTYDTRSVSAPVTWGDGTSDEMCLVLGYVTVN